jgi:dTMP kinase
MRKGRFITLDGLDGCGKSTQCRLLADWLRDRGHTVVTCREPGGTPLGDELRQILLHSLSRRSPRAEALLFMASRAELVAEVIQPALAHGAVVLCDRFLLSTVVYQGHAGGLEPGVLWEIGRFSTSGIEPDCTLLLDLPVETAFARLNRPTDQVESRGQEYFERVRQGFLTEARQRPERVRVVDATANVADVHAVITQEVNRVLETNPGT